ncbi:MAG: hypothetical protein ISP49_10065 [Reyranella sp.]|nr:hypothetical protein [Reyranella sp.]
MRYLIMAFCLVLAPLASARAQNASASSCGAEWISWWAPFHMLVPLLFFGLVAVGVIVLVRKLWPDEQRHRTSSQAHELLDERYAKGEIEREEYLRRRQDIRGS